jgi:hypothetical protein
VVRRFVDRAGGHGSALGNHGARHRRSGVPAGGGASGRAGRGVGRQPPTSRSAGRAAAGPQRDRRRPVGAATGQPVPVLEARQPLDAVGRGPAALGVRSGGRAVPGHASVGARPAAAGQPPPL